MLNNFFSYDQHAVKKTSLKDLKRQLSGKITTVITEWLHTSEMGHGMKSNVQNVTYDHFAQLQLWLYFYEKKFDVLKTT